MTINKFFIEFFYFKGFIYNNKEHDTSDNSLIQCILFNVIKFVNSLFNRYTNNYYNTDFYIKNSKVMAFSALKQYIIFKI